MPVRPITATQALQNIDQFDHIIDARSPAEHTLDHLPHALNWPTLNDQERVEIGTLYKQVNPFDAKKRGAAIAARNIAAHIEREVFDKPKHWKPLIYCWRGGNRSGALATVLAAIGFQVSLIEGGYKAARHAIVADTPAQATRLRYRVLCGPTGSGKTRLLHALAQQGAQTLDLEALAQHRSSVLGHLPGQPQPSQKRFETLIWDHLRRFKPQNLVYIECESKKVGNLRVPPALIDAMRQAPCIDLRLSDPERVALLMEDYAHFVHNQHHFCERLSALSALRGKHVVEQWIQHVHSGYTPEVVHDLLTQHYDPVYTQSIQRNFVQYPKAQTLELHNRSEHALAQAAQTLLSLENEDLLAP